MQSTSSLIDQSKRKKILWLMTGGFLLITLSIFLYWVIWGRFKEYTNDAYVSGNLIYITPQVSGIVTSIHVDNTQLIEEGHTVIELDKTDFLINFEKNKANLAAEIRNVAELFLQVKQSFALIEVAKAQFTTCAEDFERRTQLVDSGGVSVEDFEHSENALYAAYYSLAAAESSYFSLAAQVENTSIKNHPRVLKAIELLKESWVQLGRTTLKAPAKGLVAERTVQVGEHVKSGEPLCAIIPLDQMWIDANFKEVQIGKMQIGQDARIYSDVYGRAVEYHGYIEGIGGGTGSVFSVLPPQNATGNWIKIVQRVPVRIHLDPQELAISPLRLGLSMEITVDIHDIGNPSVPPLSPPASLYQTNIFSKEEQGIEPIIEKIFEENLTCEPLSLENL